MNLFNIIITALVSGGTLGAIVSLVKNILEHRRGVQGTEVETNESLLDRFERLHIEQEKRVKDFEEQLSGLRDTNHTLRTELVRERMFTDILVNHIKLDKGPPPPERPFS